MQYFDCEECGKCEEISHRELIINLDAKGEDGTSLDIEVCSNCHGGVYKFCNTTGGHTGNMKQRCERCLASRINDDLENVDGELVCKFTGCTEHHKEDLELYRSVKWEGEVLPWSEFWTMSHEGKERFR